MATQDETDIEETPEAELLEQPQSFATFLAQCEDGSLNHHLSELLQSVTAAMEELARTRGGKQKGKITLALNFERDDDGIITVRAKPDAVLPKAPRGRAIFWVNDKGHLVRENPRQHKLPLRTVDPGPIRQV